MTIDRERAAVYAAELAAFDGTDLEVVVEVSEVIELIDRVLTAEWWPGGSVSARPARRDAHSSTTTCSEGSDPTIRIAAGQATLATATHELAHALAGVDAGHGPLFRRAHLDVVLVATNVDRVCGRGPLHVEQLADAYSKAGLGIAERRWPAPVAGDPIAL